MKGSNQFKLGAFSHIGLVVEDVDAAVDFYARTLGLGPFTTDIYEMKGMSHRGRRTDARVKAAIGYSGDVFIELVQVLEGETPHTEFLREHGEGMQHMAFPVDDMEAAKAELAKEGIVPILEYQFRVEDAPVTDPDPSKRRPMDVHEVYFSTDEKAGGAVIQLMQLKEVG